MTPLLGYKIGMTRVFDEQGKNVPVTAVRIDPCVVTQLKTAENDGYTAVQIGSGTKRHPNKPEQGHAKNVNAVPQHLREFRLTSEELADFTLGQELSLTGLEIGTTLRVTGVSKGKGFAGVIKRHHFSRGPETHGSDHHRAPGSAGSMYPQHVLRGHRMPGHLGNEQCTIRKVKVVDIIPEHNLVLVKGPVPGSRGALIEIAPM